jgi:hypothetical protein
MALLTEIGTAFQPPYEQTRREVETRVFPGILRMLSLPIPVSGRVLGDGGVSIVNAELILPKLDFQYGESVHSGNFGRYHLWLPQGTWEALVEAPGYEPMRVNLTTSEKGTATDIRMVPNKASTTPNKASTTPATNTVGGEMIGTACCKDWCPSNGGCWCYGYGCSTPFMGGCCHVMSNNGHNLPASCMCCDANGNNPIKCTYDV